MSDSTVQSIALAVLPETAEPLLRPGDVVLFQGDSITDAFRRPEEVNNALQLGAGFAFLVAARMLYTRPNDRMNFINRGVAGDTAQKLLARWDDDALALRPDVLSLLIGVNDAMDGAFCAARYEAALHEMLTKTREAAADARLVLCEPFILPCGLATPSRLRAIEACQQVVASAAEEYHARLVPFAQAFAVACENAPPEHWAYDGIHATAAGAALMAETWLHAVEGRDF